MKALSDLELALLRYLATNNGATARDIADGFGKANGYARTTVHTLLDRLRKKGYVTREQSEGTFVYATALPQSELMGAVVAKFVKKALGGSVSPLVSYLVQQGEFSDEELAQLEGLLEQIKEGKDGA